MAFLHLRKLKLSNKFPLAHFEYEDALYWPLSQDGGYTCKLGYRFLKEEDDVIPQEDVESWDKLLWKGVWSLQSPNKIKNLMWRAC